MWGSAHMSVCINAPLHMQTYVPSLMSVYSDMSMLCQYQCHRPQAGCIWLAPWEDLGSVEVSGVARSVSAPGGGSWVAGSRWPSQPRSSLFRCSVRKTVVSAPLTFHRDRWLFCCLCLLSFYFWIEDCCIFITNQRVYSHASGSVRLHPGTMLLWHKK